MNTNEHIQLFIGVKKDLVPLWVEPANSVNIYCEKVCYRDLDILPGISAIHGGVSYDILRFLIQIGFTEVTQKSVCVFIRLAWI